MTPIGFAPRPAEEIAALMKGAYGRDIDPADLSPGLDVIAQALNRGDLGRAMIAALRLRLPDLNWEGATRIAKADEALTKYDPSEPRDWHGRWTTDGESHPEAPGPGSPPGTLKPIFVSNLRAANDNFTDRACIAASTQCQVTALGDKGRTPYFSNCQKAEVMCQFVLAISRLDPYQPFCVIFPDRTVVDIKDGTATVTHIGGSRLDRPLQ